MGRALREKIFQLLRTLDLGSALEEIRLLPPRKAINPLLSFLYHQDPALRWAAVKATAAVVVRLADEDMEAARVIMRRLMWNLNDESGGIGWGSPEAMGEILASHEGLAKEYTHVLISYLRPDGNYLELEGLQRGLLWAIGRLALERPEPVRKAVPYLRPYLASDDPAVRGLAAWILGLVSAREAIPLLEALLEDLGAVPLYLDGRVQTRQVKTLALESLERIRALNPQNRHSGERGP